MLEPNVIVLYVEDLALTSQFYRNVLGRMPIEASEAFHRFELSNGMHLALKLKSSVVPPTETKSGHGELAFTVDSHEQVDALCAQWQAQEIRIIFPPTQLPFGHTFVALDPDGYRLRVVSLGNAS